MRKKIAHLSCSFELSKGQNIINARCPLRKWWRGLKAGKVADGCLASYPM